MTDRYKLVDRIAVPCEDLAEWATAFESRDRIVSQTTIGRFRVSTVFLGIDHSYSGSPPLLFETMVFAGKWSGQQTRCTTWAEAEAMHRDAENIAQTWTEGSEIGPRP